MDRIEELQKGIETCIKVLQSCEYVEAVSLIFTDLINREKKLEALLMDQVRQNQI